MACPKCGFDQDAYKRDLEPVFEKTYDDVLPFLRRKAKIKGFFVGIFIAIALFFLPSPSRRSFTISLSYLFSDSILLGVFLFFVALFALCGAFGIILAKSWKEEKLWQKYVAQKMKQLKQA